ncbi:hypothetical protein N7499_007013 [Penicillium canescens]|nr:hypothetical protein N7499_007013 [Penicillium canescens]KAJ6176064.1 hypothetical protein N7485_002978 [Penicillium canescens]
METIIERLEHTRLNDEPEVGQLLFKPPLHSGLAATALDDIPRYLFRVVTPYSDGTADETWVRSQSASQSKASSVEDIFHKLDLEKRMIVAQTLNLHLRWWPKGDLDDNFVSWTSSLLFAIRYIFYRHLSTEDESRWEDIKLYVIDTAQFPKGTFLADVDLIQAFCEYDTTPGKNLGSLKSLRKKEGYYFGEYLSQGSLKIENKFVVIPAKDFFDSDQLCRLQPHFGDIQIPDGKPEWANEVIRLRKAIWPGNDLPKLSSEEIGSRLRVMNKILTGLSPRWRFPLAIYFMTLIGTETVTSDQGDADDNVFFEYFRSDPIHEGRQALLPPDFNLLKPEKLPEMKRVKTLVLEIHQYYNLRQALDHIKLTETSLNGVATRGGSSSHNEAERNEVLLRTSQLVLSRLRTVQMLCEKVILVAPEEVRGES